MPLVAYLGHLPTVGPETALDEGAYLVGQVRIEGPAWLGTSAVLRGDKNRIEIGARFCMGARSTIHVEGRTPVQIGTGVWIGEDAVVHACSLGDGVRVEDGGLVLSGSRVGAGSIVAADSLVSEGATFDENSYISGTPGRRVRDTTPQERQETQERIAGVLG